MEKISRRKFLGVLGLSSVGALAATLVPSWAISNASSPGSTRKETHSFRALGGLPQGPLPSYASYVIEGTVNLATRSGTITKNVFVGPPELTATTVALPGLTRIVRVTNVDTYDRLLLVSGQIEDVSNLQPGEKSRVDLTIDRVAGIVRSTFLDSGMILKIVSG